MRVLKYKVGSRIMEHFAQQRLESSREAVKESKKLLTKCKKLKALCDELLKARPRRRKNVSA